METLAVDALVLGGGIAGLWTADALARAGWSTAVLESGALGTGQTIGAQGIIHGGGKYALRGVRDFAAVQACARMPWRWSDCLAGFAEPDLVGAPVLSDRCLLWLPKASLLARLQAWGFLDVIARAGLLAIPPARVRREEWPPAIAQSAAAVFALAEPVVGTRGLLARFAARRAGAVWRCDGPSLAVEHAGGTWTAVVARPAPDAPPVRIAATLFVLAAGAGNAGLLERAGVDPRTRMQRRPLRMLLLKGPLPPLYGHAVVGGKTALTITARGLDTDAPATDGDVVWQIGGEIAERVPTGDRAGAGTDLAWAARELARLLRPLDLSACRIGRYEAIRAEAATAGARRPSGVHVEPIATNALVAWPTKLALAPLVADEVLTLAATHRPAGGALPAFPGFVAPEVARFPWQDVEWFPAR